MRNSGSDGLRVRPIKRSDAVSVARLMRSISREFGAQPIHSEVSMKAVFDSPWLERGDGLVMSDEGEVAAYGWARDTTWNSLKYIHVGLFIGAAYRKPEKYSVITEPLLRLARDLGRKYGTPEAIIFYQSIDTAHPNIVRSIGFRDLPTTMIGFRHDLKRLPGRQPPGGIRLRPARLPEERDRILGVAERSFDDPVNQGEPMAPQYWDMLVGMPGFRPGQIQVAVTESAAPQAAHDEEIVGYIVMRIDPGRPESADIHEVGVLPEWRGRGVGAALISCALDWVRSQEVRTALIGAFSTNRSAVMYWRLGFRPEAVRTYYFFTRKL